MGERVEDHFKLVSHIAKRYCNRQGIEFQDVFQEGCIGLMRACKEYKEGPVPFSSFAGQHISFSILSYLKKIDTIRMPHSVITLAGRMVKYDFEKMSVKEIAEKEGEKEYLVELAIEHLKRKILSIYQEEKNEKEEYKPLRVINRLFVEKEENGKIFIGFLEKNKQIRPIEKQILNLLYDNYLPGEIAEILNKKVSYIYDVKQKLKKKFINNKNFLDNYC